MYNKSNKKKKTSIGKYGKKTNKNKKRMSKKKYKGQGKPL